MPKNRAAMPGRISLFLLAISLVITLVGIVIFFTPHETLPVPEGVAQEDLVKDGYAQKYIILLDEKVSEGNMIKRKVNGRVLPVISARPGEVQQWNITNSSNDYITFSVPGISFYLIQKNANALPGSEKKTEELLAPQDTVQIIIETPSWGSYEVVSLPTQVGSDMYPHEKILILKSEGLPVF